MGHCGRCNTRSRVEAMGMETGGADYVVALAGNPNTGKSTVFNALTGLRQHTGNWPGKTVMRAEGAFARGGITYKLVDLPGTYSLLSASQDEEVARDFILFGQPDCTVVVCDGTCLERNLDLAFQVMEITPSVVVCVNLLDEARRKGIDVDLAGIEQSLGVPVVGTVARTGEGIPDLIGRVAGVIDGSIPTDPHHPEPPPALAEAINELTAMVEEAAPGIPSARWIAYRLLDGDYRVRTALETGELAEIARAQAVSDPSPRTRAMSGGRQ